MQNADAKPPKVLVTGAGAVIGYGIIKSLRLSTLKTRVIAVDANPWAVGFRFADQHEVCPPANSPGYRDFMAGLCAREGVSVVIPGIEQDVEALIKYKAYIERNSGARLALNDARVYEIARDKWNTFLFLNENNLPAPATFLITDPIGIKRGLTPPFLLKPRFGQAGKGIVRVDEWRDFEYWASKVDKYIAQEIVGTEKEEYTVGLFGLGDGTFAGPVVMRRTLNYGTTFEAHFLEHQEVEKTACSIARSLRPLGPTNMQFRIDGGVPKLLEINPRMSSSASLKAAFGFNEAEMSVRYYLYGEREFSPAIKKGLAQRYIEDLIFPEG